jgi:hypothetical protein
MNKLVECFIEDLQSSLQTLNAPLTITRLNTGRLEPGGRVHNAKVLVGALPDELLVFHPFV